LLLLLPATCALAQSDSVAVDSVIRHSFIPTGIRVGTDLISLVKTQVQDDFNAWEVNADVDFYRYYLAMDYGASARTFRSDSGNYSNDGTYWRAGVDINFLAKDPERNMFFIGARYGRATFSQDLTVYAYNDFTGEYEDLSYTDPVVNARWFELTTGLRVKMWKMIWMGYTARFKFGLKYDDTENIIPTEVPGYGRTHKDSYWGFNYQILIRIPVRKTPPVEYKVKKKKF
jgi:hypothetical protein